MMGCYGDDYARTPVFDGLAAKGIRYTKAHAIAPVCSVSRSSIITGMYPTSLGTHHHRSNVGRPPAFLKMVPNLMREAGYYTSNNAKRDYNIGGDRWHESSGKAHWRNRPDKGQPFFAVFNYGACHSSITKIPEEAIVRQRLNRLRREDFHDPAGAPIPPCHPDVPEFRKAWPRYYDAVTQVDCQAGELIEQLKADELPGCAASPVLELHAQRRSGPHLRRCRGLARQCGRRSRHRSGVRLDNHVPDIAARDLFTVPTVTFRVLYVFIILRHDRRQVVHFNVTTNPHAEWTAQQMIDAFPYEEAPRDVEPPSLGEVVSIPQANGLHHRYTRRAA